MTTNYRQLIEAAIDLPPRHPVSRALASAEENAYQTIYVEKARPAAEGDAIALDSIAFTPEFTENREVRDWFAANGYRW